MSIEQRTKRNDKKIRISGALLDDSHDFSRVTYSWGAYYFRYRYTNEDINQASDGSEFEALGARLEG